MLRVALGTSVLASVVVLLGGCGDSEGTGDGSATEASGTVGTSTTPGSAPADATTDGGPPCPNSPPEEFTIHDQPITADETWSASTFHTVTGDVRITQGATVTVEACTWVAMAGSIQAGEGSYSDTPEVGILDVQGEPGREVRFVGTAVAAWGRLASEGRGELRIRHAILEGGGADLDADGLFTGVIFARGADGPVPTELHLEHVTIEGSDTNGISVGPNVRWSAESTDVSVHGTVFPVIVVASAWGGVPDGDYTGNETDVVMVDPRLSALGGEATVRRLAVPYYVRPFSATDTILRVGISNGSVAGQLTIEPGTVVAFHAGSSLAIFEGSSLTALGTEAEPITFTWRDPGSTWDGIGIPGGSGSVLDHVIVEGAGGITNSNCSPGNGYGIAIFGEPPAAFVTNSHFADIDGHAIHRAWEGEPVDFLPTNTFERIVDCQQSYPQDSSGACPRDPPCP